MTQIYLLLIYLILNISRIILDDIKENVNLEGWINIENAILHSSTFIKNIMKNQKLRKFKRKKNYRESRKLCHTLYFPFSVVIYF